MQDDVQKSFKDDGYFVVRGLFDADRCREWASAIDKYLFVKGEESRFYPGGPNWFPEFWDMVVDSDLCNVLRRVFDSDPRYLLVGDLHANTNTNHWHRDFALRGVEDQPVAKDDVNRFAVAKLAVYVDPGSCGLALVPGSQRKSISRFFGVDIYKDEFLNSKNGVEEASRLGLPAPKLVPAQTGDVIGFDPRIYHAGCFVDLESNMPSATQSAPKKNIFISYGTDEYWSKLYYYYYRYYRRDLLYREVPKPFVDLLNSYDLYPTFDTYDPAMDGKWLSENLISPPCFAEEFAEGALIGTPKWYEVLGDGFRTAGHSFAASRSYEMALDAAFDNRGMGSEMSLSELSRPSTGWSIARELFEKMGTSRADVGDTDGSMVAFKLAREIDIRNPWSRLRAWLRTNI